MAERNLEQELESVRAEMLELQQQNAQLAQSLKKLSDVVKNKMPSNQSDTFTHNEIDQLALSITRR